MTKLTGLANEKIAIRLLEILPVDREVEENVEFQLDVNVIKKVALPFGEVVTNCTECKMTCHPDCGLTGGLYDCDVMDHSMEENVLTCRVCPKKCLWNVHANESFKWINVKESQSISLNTMKRKYETSGLTWQELADQLEEDVEDAKGNVVDLVETLLNFVKQVIAIAKQQNLKLTPQWVEVVWFINIDVLNTLIYSEEQV